MDSLISSLGFSSGTDHDVCYRHSSSHAALNSGDTPLLPPGTNTPALVIHPNSPIPMMGVSLQTSPDRMNCPRCLNGATWEQNPKRFPVLQIGSSRLF
ncbi:hypothetical protein NL676_032196 [Syzygium grande]|nr:hypothetical protein NL676_032196 [Syzygium grande]